MSFRPFVLAPACDIAEDWLHPVLQVSLEGLLSQLGNGGDGMVFFGGSAEERRGWAEQVRITHPKFCNWLEPHELPYVILTHADAEWEAGARLSISLDQSAIPGIPRLSLADCDPSHFAAEIDAAIECVWPTGG
jgi:hypothetical protein